LYFVVDVRQKPEVAAASQETATAAAAQGQEDLEAAAASPDSATAVVRQGLE
jgi:hypothetical protein